MKNLSNMLAYKYLRYKHKESAISLMLSICFFGIVVGTFSLMLTLIITNGFEEVISEKMQGINAHVVVSAGGKRIDITPLRHMLLDEFSGQVTAVAGSTTKQLLIEHDDNQTLIFLKGVEPQYERAVTTIEQKLVGSSHTLPVLLEDDGIIIGHKLAKNLGVQAGDRVNLLIPEPSSTNKIILTKQRATVTGIINVGLDEYDSGFGFCNHDFLREVFDEKDGFENVALKLSPTRSWRNWVTAWDDRLVTQLKERLVGLQVYSWKELYPALVSSLKLEKYAMFFIIALISLVASMSMISLLFIFMQQKRRDIAILLTMGMQPKDISKIFLRIGMTVTLLGSALGLGLAACVGYVLQHYPFIELPDVYFVSHLPARMNIEIFIVVFVCITLLGFFATWLPARRARKLNITHVLRAE